jgi:hypothetical protein
MGDPQDRLFIQLRQSPVMFRCASSLTHVSILAPPLLSTTFMGHVRISKAAKRGLLACLMVMLSMPKKAALCLRTAHACSADENMPWGTVGIGTYLEHTVINIPNGDHCCSPCIPA